jgi:hypothetical protein
VCVSENIDAVVLRSEKKKKKKKEGKKADPIKCIYNLSLKEKDQTPSKTKKKALTFVLSAIEVTGFPLLSTRSVPYAIAFTSVLIVFLIDFAFCNIFFFQIVDLLYLNLYLCFLPLETRTRLGFALARA